LTTAVALPLAAAQTPAIDRRAVGGLRRPTRRVCLEFAGAFDRRSVAALESTARGCRRFRGAPGAATVHIDLSDVTALDLHGVEGLNQAWRLLTRLGWSVTFSTPNLPDARAFFVCAAIRGQLAWARGSRHS
jgi:hypothetical protein